MVGISAVDEYLKKQIEKREFAYVSFTFGYSTQHGSLIKKDCVSRRFYQIQVTEWEKAFTIEIKLPLIKEIRFEYLK